MSKEIEKDMLFMTDGDKELCTLEEELEKLEEEKEKELEKMEEAEADPFEEDLPEVLRIDQENDMISPDEIEKTLYIPEEQMLIQEEKEGSYTKRNWDFNRDPVKVMPDYDKGVLTIEKHTDFKGKSRNKELSCRLKPESTAQKKKSSIQLAVSANQTLHQDHNNQDRQAEREIPAKPLRNLKSLTGIDFRDILVEAPAEFHRTEQRVNHRADRQEQIADDEILAVEDITPADQMHVAEHIVAQRARKASDQKNRKVDPG